MGGGGIWNQHRKSRVRALQVTPQEVAEAEILLLGVNVYR
jgi:hypothetical protein